MTEKQHILVFQQNKSGEGKIKGITLYGKDRFNLEVVSIDEPLPPVVDDALDYLPEKIRADMVLDFLKHPDLSYDLCTICSRERVPAVASGKKWRIRDIYTPPT